MARRRHPRRHHRRPRGQPRGASRRSARGLRVLPRSAGARVGDGRPPRGRRRRHPRQDHDHLAADRRAAALPAPTRRTPIGGELSATGATPTTGSRRPVRRRGRRERRRLPRLPPVRRDGHQRRGRPPRPVGDRGGLPRGVRPSSSTAIDPGGFLVCCVDDPGAATWPRRPAPGLRVVASARPRRRRAGQRPALRRRHPRSPSSTAARAGRVTLQIPGRHYVLDALAALAVGLAARLRLRRPARAGSASFTGTARRMERKGEAGGVRVYDSYAHHPTEIAGDLQAARAVAGDGPAGRRLPAAPGLAHPDLRRRDGRRARRRRRGRRARRLPRPRGPRPRGHRRAGRRRRAAAARSGCASCPTSTTSPAELVARARPGDLVLTLGAGTSPRSGRACWSCWRAGDDDQARDPQRPARRRDERTPRAFARRQWARRWLAWRYVARRPSLAGRARRRRCWLVFFSSVLAVQAVDGQGADLLSDDAGRGGRRRTRRASRWPARPRRHRGPASRRSPPCARPT